MSSTLVSSQLLRLEFCFGWSNLQYRYYGRALSQFDCANGIFQTHSTHFTSTYVAYEIVST